MPMTSREIDAIRDAIHMRPVARASLERYPNALNRWDSEGA
jgi:hypothetical protein